MSRQQRICPHCARPMIAAARPYDDAHVQHFVFCQKCRSEELGEVVPGYLEVEHEWSLDVSARGAPSVSALRALRKVPELSAVPLTALARRLGEGVLTVGPFSAAKARDLRAELQAAGLVAEFSKAA